MIDAIQLRVTADNLKEMGQNGQLMSYINLTPTTVSILSKLLHITADTLIDGNVITSGMLQAGAVTADKLAASIIELTKSQGIKGGGATLDTNGLTVRGNDGSYVVHGSNGMEFHDGNGNTFAMVGAMVMGTVKDGQWVKFTKPWKNVPNVIVTPISLQTAIPGYNSTNLYLDCRPQNVTNNGFQAICRTVLRAGSGGSVPVNEYIENVDSTIDLQDGFVTPGWSSSHTSYNYYGTKKSSKTIEVPADATETSIVIKVDAMAYGESESDGEGGVLKYGSNLTVSLSISKDNNVIKKQTLTNLSSLGSDKSSSYTTTIKIDQSGTIKLEVETNLNPKYSAGNIWYASIRSKIMLSSYSFNTTADVPLASGNAFFLCTDQHNSPYTISDSQ